MTSSPKNPDIQKFDTMTDGAFSAPTSGERTTRIRAWLSQDPPLEHLQEKCSDLEAKLVVTDQQLTDCSLKNKELEFRVSEQQAELVATNKELADSKLYVAALQHQVHKYKQQGFFDRLFGRTPK